MKRKNLKLQIILLIVVSILAIYGISTSYMNHSLTEQKNYKENATAITQLPGTYTSIDGKTITVTEDGTTKYLDTYALTVTEAATGNILSGNIGTNNKTVKFYQINDHIIVSGTTVTYTYNSATEYLYDYTVFSLETTHEPSTTGTIEIWRDNQKVNSYNTLQAAIDSANAGDTVKITKDLTVTEGTYINKNITIDGNGYELDSSNWKNGVFIIEKNSNVILSNLNIEGGAPGFAIDYDAVTYTNNTIPLVSGSDTNDKKQNVSTITTKGNLNITKSKMNNFYATSGSVINAIEGKLTINECELNHNRAEEGGAIYLGRAFTTDETKYPLQEVTIINSKLNNNYASKNGGVLFLRNVNQVTITNSELSNNTVSPGSGGIAYIYRDKPSGYNSTAEKLGLDFMQLKIDNSTIENNWVGNDGFAIQSHDGEITITNSKFANNVGIHPSSSVGTISTQISRTERAIHTIDNCTFESNYGAASVLGDHSSNVGYNVTNTTFTENSGIHSIMFYSSISKLENCKFIKEKTYKEVIAALAYEQTHKEPTLTIKNTTFENNDVGIDIRVRKRNHDLTLPSYTINLENTNAKIELWDESYANISGTYSGNLNADSSITEQYIKIEEGTNLTGNITYHNNKYSVELVYSTPEYEKIYKYLYLEKDKTYTNKELYLLHEIGGENITLEYYTDANYTTAWDYVATDNLVLYTKKVNHVHTYDGDLVLHKNVIYEQAECGYLGKALKLSKPNNLVEDGTEKKVVITNELNITNYTITYYINQNQEWIETTTPIAAGTYKAVLTYNDLEISQEYSILEAPKVEEPKEEEKEEENNPPVVEEEQETEETQKEENNPFTSNNASKIISLSITLIISIALFVLCILQNKKLKNNI